MNKCYYIYMYIYRRKKYDKELVDGSFALPSALPRRSGKLFILLLLKMKSKREDRERERE